METQALWTEDLTEQETEDLVENLAFQIRKRKLETPAILFLEMNKPVTRLAGNALIVFTPFIAPFVGMDNVHNYSRLLMERENVERLILKLEEDRPADPPVEEQTP